MHALQSVSLVSTPAAAVIYAVVIVTALVALWRPTRRTAWAAIGALAVLAIVAFGLSVWPKPFPDSVPWTIYASGAAAAFVLFSAMVQRGRRILLALLAVVAVAAAYLSTNLIYQQYPTIGSIRPAPVAAPMSLEQFQATTAAPTLDGREVGALVTMPAEPLRDAVVYIPPAYWHGATLPVLVLLSGSPGKPIDWFITGQAAEALDDFQTGHDGVAPIVVSADPIGAETNNPACVDGPDYQIQTYLSQDIPQKIRQNFRVNPDQHTWTIGGLSYGGTCSLQIVTNSPQSYGSFLDFSGEPEPTLGNHQQTVDKLFDGDEEAFQAVNPETLLRDAAGTPKYRGIAGRFVSGERDTIATAALPHLNDLAHAAGMDTTYETRPGAHSYAVWRVALRENLDFVAQRGGITEGESK